MDVHTAVFHDEDRGKKHKSIVRVCSYMYVTIRPYTSE